MNQVDLKGLQLLGDNLFSLEHFVMCADESDEESVSSYA